MKELECEICSKAGFKNRAGLEGHKKIAHGVDNRKTYPDEISRQYESLKTEVGVLKTQMASTIDSEKAIDSEDKVVNALKLLLPAIEKYDLAVVNLSKDEGGGFLSNDITKYRIVRNSDIIAGLGMLEIEMDAKEF